MSDILEMTVEMTIIDNLGIKMYSNLSPVLGEMISNAYDADATEINITIPEGGITEDSEIVIQDNGTGMSFQEINETYLSVGRNRRKNPETAVTPIFKRKVMGRKGIGKLSAFGVANIIEITTFKDNKTTVFTLDLDRIRSTQRGERYCPEFSRDESTDLKNGTVIKLKNLSRQRGITISKLKTNLARRFSCIDSNFKIILNGDEITATDRNLKERCEFSRDYDAVIDEENGYKVKGWIGAFGEQVPSDIVSGVVIMVRKKLAQEPTFFDVPTSGWINMARFYIVGEIEADFLDIDESEDMVLVNRSSIDWASEIGQKILQWGQKEVKNIANEWGQRQKAKKESVIRENPQFAGWFDRLTPPEKKTANKIVKAITSDGGLPDERALELAEYMKESFDYQVFRDLSASISDEPTIDDRKLIELFHEWQVIEAREVLRIANGRLLAIEQLEKMINTNAREVPEIHQFLSKYPWILDPSWTIAYNETYYSTLLKNTFPEPQEKPEPNKRLDFVCFGAGDTIHVVELKRPRQKIGKAELEQLEEYVAFVQQRLGNAPNGRSYQSAAGYIIGDDIEDNYLVIAKKQNLEKSRMYVRKYADLLSMAQRLHQDFSRIAIQ